jgi:alginate O-acetyltransferase complex protein AlgJ
MTDRIETETTRWNPREQQALDELGTTRFVPGGRWALIALFLATITVVPAIEAVLDVSTALKTRARLTAEGVPVSELPGRRPRALNVVDLLPLPRAADIRWFENDLLQESEVGKAVRPWLQTVLTNWLGVGNRSVVLGADDWLYYVDDVNYVSGEGFLSSSRLSRSTPDANAADPRPAIRQMHRELHSMGVELVVVPVPGKAVIRPQSLARELTGQPVQNSSWGEFVRELRGDGIRLLDLTEALGAAQASGVEQFLRTDSHWSPAAVDLAARSLADILINDLKIQPEPVPRYTRGPSATSQAPDLLPLLNLPSGRFRGASAEVLSLSSIVEASSGAVWRPDPTSDVLFVGDSFMEIFSERSAAAGLAELTSLYLQHSLDRRTGRRFGKFDTRQDLGRTVAELRESVRGRRVVVWEFAIRKLYAYEWPLLP